MHLFHKCVCICMFFNSLSMVMFLIMKQNLGLDIMTTQECLHPKLLWRVP